MTLATQVETVTQYTVFDGIRDMLAISPVFIIGFAVLALFLVFIFKKDSRIPKVKTVVLSFLFFYYISIMFSKVVGIPTISECIRLISLNVPLFNPNINLLLFEDGLGLTFILNIILFIPLGLLCPFISNTFKKIGYTFLMGFGLSFAIEISQLFTLYRVSDINDLIANTAGAMIGYLFFLILTKLKLAKPYKFTNLSETDYTKYIPIFIIICGFILGFFSDIGFVY